MKINLEVFSALERERYHRVKNMTKEELSTIRPIWTNIYRKEDWHSPNLYADIGEESVIIEVALDKLILYSNFLGLNPKALITDDSNDFRYVKIIERWEKGLCIDPPEMAINDSDSIISFVNGRHRTIAAHMTGAKVIPIVINKSDDQAFNSIKVK